MATVGGAVYLIASLAHLHPRAEASAPTTRSVAANPTPETAPASAPAKTADNTAKSSPAAPTAAAGNTAASSNTAASGAAVAPAENAAIRSASSITATPSDTLRTEAPAVDPAALTALRNEIGQVKQQLATTSANYEQASASIEQTRQAMATLSAQNSQLQAQLGDAVARAKSAQEARDEADRRAKAAEQALNGRSSNLAQLQKTIEQSKAELEQSETERTNLQNRVQQLQLELQTAESHARQLGAQLDAKNQPQPQPQVAAEPNHGTAAVPAAPAFAPQAQPPQALPQSAIAPPPERKPAPSPQAQRDSPQRDSSQLERLLASTGLDVDRMLKTLDHGAGEGGPYIALNDPRAAGLDQQRLADLKRLAKMLPLASPLPQYQLESDFGARVDPINHRESFHPGLDMSATYKSAVYSTAPGVVIFTGTMDAYGRVVEIDHGHGIVTRYAHLHRILVAKGQKVALHTEIGELGSTGRSTGPHLHYEVRVDGTTVDPAKFMEAGKNVVQVSGK